MRRHACWDRPRYGGRLWVSALCCLAVVPSMVLAEGRTIDLEEAYGLAAKTQEQVLIAEIEVVKGKRLPTKAATILIPRVRLNRTYTKLNDPIQYEAQLGNLQLPPIQTVPQSQRADNLEIVWPLYQAEFFPARKKAYEMVAWNRENYLQTFQEALFQTAQAYYGVLKARRLLENAWATHKLALEEFRVAEVRVSAGDTTEDAVLRADLNVQRAQSQIIRAEGRLDLAREVLNRRLGIRDERIFPREPPGLAEETDDLDALVQRAFENRHDYKKAASGVKMAETDISLVRARFHPRLEGSWNYYSVSEASWLQEDEYWALSLRLQFPLFEGGTRVLDLQDRKESRNQALLSLQELKRDIEIEVREAVTGFATQKALLESAVRQAALAEKNQEILLSKYRYGAATFSELSEALLSLDLARAEVITSSIDHEIGILNIQRATGVFASQYLQKSGKL